MSFSYYKSVTVDHTQCGTADSSSFPVVIAVTDVDLKGVGSGGYVQNASGYDIRPYSDISLSTPLTFELVEYSTASGQLEMHIKIPTLSHTTDTVFYLGFGDTSISTDGSSASTWDGNFKSVWHLAAGPGGSLSTTDSIGANNLTLNTGPVSTSSGELGGGLSMTGAGNLAKTSSISGIPATNAAQTISAWFKKSSNVAKEDILALQNRPTNNSNQLVIESGNIEIAQWGGGVLISTTAPSANNWHFTAWTWDGSNNNLYVDSTAPVSNATAPQSGSPDSIYLGSYDGGENWNGQIDEVRVSSIARPTSWITAEYNNQKPSSTFLTFGTRTASITSQIAYPVSDISTGSWTPSTGVLFYATVDETVADDSDYDLSDSAPANDPLTMGLTPQIGTPQAGTTSFTIRIRLA